MILVDITPIIGFDVEFVIYRYGIITNFTPTVTFDVQLSSYTHIYLRIRLIIYVLLRSTVNDPQICWGLWATAHSALISTPKSSTVDYNNNYILHFNCLSRSL